jgi:hypothetical protein
MSKLNGENIAGAAFLFFSALLMYAGQVNAVFGKLYPAYYILVAAGIALVFWATGPPAAKQCHT